jgi:hypothetical protein
METTIQDVMIHLAGNKAQDQDLFLSDQPGQLDEEIRNRLCAYFLSRFGHVYEQYHFSEQPQGNIVAQESEGLFDDPSTLVERSRRIAMHLYNCATHPRIKPGELYVTMFDGYIHEGIPVRAVGIFKTELKNGYFEVRRSNISVSMEYREGIDIHKFDKGCLILEHPDGEKPVVLIIDQQSRGDEAVYWKDHFLGLEQRRTNFSMTSLALQATKNFVTDYLDQETDLDKTEKIDLMNRSASFFKDHDEFQKKNFEEEVLEAPALIQQYRRYEQERRERSEEVPDDSFRISSQAVKQQVKIFKSVLKLDRNFHVYIHGNRELIQRGTDPDGRKFYKIYFDEES